MKKLTKYITALMLTATMFFLTGCPKTKPDNSHADEDHEYVDLGLPSGTLWATCNVGAEKPEDNGNYFAWGETEPKESYDWSTYKYCNEHYDVMGDLDGLTKYSNFESYGHEGFIDSLVVLEPIDDAATANWGKGWCTPSEEQWMELYLNTEVTPTEQNGVKGYLFTSSNGKSIFLPFSGHRYHNELEDVGESGNYWGNALCFVLPCGSYIPLVSWEFAIGYEDDYYTSSIDRYFGLTVRPVRSEKSKSTAVEGQAVNHKEKHHDTGTHDFVDLGLPSGTQWATCNVGANNPEDYGDYFAWGEIEPKKYYDWESTYKFSKGNECYLQLTKYCTEPYDGYNGFSDDLTALESEDDAATANWGGDWFMPTPEQCEELCMYTWQEETEVNGIKGVRFTGMNDNSIFLPYAGYRQTSLLKWEGKWGEYWTNALGTIGPDFAQNLSVGEKCYMSESYRDEGFPVRPVRTKAMAQQHDYIDFNLPSGTLWATCNVGAAKPEDYGAHFAWGETQLKRRYNWKYYKHGDWYKQTKYCTDSKYGEDGFIDGLSTLEPDDDVATYAWGEDWFIPTAEQWQELLDNVPHFWRIWNGVKVIQFSGDNGYNLIIPAAGDRWDDEFEYDDGFEAGYEWDMELEAGKGGHYWSSSLCPEDSNYALSLWFDQEGEKLLRIDRCCGSSIRPVTFTRKTY